MSLVFVNREAPAISVSFWAVIGASSVAVCVSAMCDTNVKVFEQHIFSLKSSLRLGVNPQFQAHLNRRLQQARHSHIDHINGLLRPTQAERKKKKRKRKTCLGRVQPRTAQLHFGRHSLSHLLSSRNSLKLGYYSAPFHFVHTALFNISTMQNKEMSYSQTVNVRGREKTESLHLTAPQRG